MRKFYGVSPLELQQTAIFNQNIPDVTLQGAMEQHQKLQEAVAKVAAANLTTTAEEGPNWWLWGSIGFATLVGGWAAYTYFFRAEGGE